MALHSRVPEARRISRSETPPQQHRPDGEPGADRREQHQLPFFSRPDATASFSASGIVAAVVLPNRSMLMITFSGVDAELFGRRLDDAAVGLVRHEQIEIGRR